MACRGRGLSAQRHNGCTTAIAAASFGAVAGSTVASSWLSPAAACLLLLWQPLRGGSCSRDSECVAPSPLCLPGAHSTLPNRSSDGRRLPSLSASVRAVAAAGAPSAGSERRMARARFSLRTRSIIILKHYQWLLKKAL